MSLGCVSRSVSRAADRRARAARWQAAATLAGLSGTAALLPDPVALLRQVSGRDPIEVLSSAMLLAAATVVWALLAWAAVVGIALGVARLPGLPGRAGRAAVRRMTPAAAGRILLVSAGISLIAGTSACGTPAGTSRTPPAVTVAAAVTGPSVGAGTAPDTLPAAPRTRTPNAGTGPGADPAALPNLDWPVAGHDATADPTTGAAESAAPQPVPSATGLASWTTPALTPRSSRSVAPPTATGPTTHTRTAAPAARGSSSPISSPDTGTATSTPAAPARHGPAVREQSGTTLVSQPSPTRPGGETPGSAGSPSSPSLTDSTGQAQHPGDDTAPATGTAGARSNGPRTTVTVTVRPGDSLWSIAARHLAPGASDAQVDAAWRAWYAANRPVIGADPDLILPGQLLHAPDPEVNQP